MHISDWLPTLASVAGIKLDGPVDGHNMWPALSFKLPSPRKEVLLNFDVEIPYSSFIYQKWKYINGTTANGNFDGWLSDDVNRKEHDNTLSNYGEAISSSPVGRALSPFSKNKTLYGMFVGWLSEILGGDVPSMSNEEINFVRQQSFVDCKGVSMQTDLKRQCNPLKGACLFDIVADPCERRNIISEEIFVEAFMEKRIRHLVESARPPQNRPEDPCSNPAYFNNTWVSWFDMPRPQDCQTSTSVNFYADILLFQHF